MTMKPGLGWTGDPALHLIAVSTALLGAAVAAGSYVLGPHASVMVKHPPGCHACSLCSPESVAARDAFLIRTGAVLPEDGGE
jgi:hypothetical protein